MIKIIIAGSRTITDREKVFESIIKGISFLVQLKKLECPASESLGFETKLIDSIEIVSGNARGVDIIGEEFAKTNTLPLKVFPADWNQYGKRAGYLRNKQMAEYADALILIWDGKSRGSQMMLELAKQYKLKIYEQIIPETV